jgi:uncharacterized protein (DUF2336 family)
MLVREFLTWLETASVSRRADAASALARAYLHGDGDNASREGMEASITILLDDPAPIVRFALADALASSPDAPRHAILTFAADQIDIAAMVVARSPVFLDSELVDLVASMSDTLQEAIASRPRISPGVSAALTELGGPFACRLLLANEGATIANVSLSRLCQRYGDDPEIRAILLDRPDLPIELRQSLVRSLSHALGELAMSRSWMDRSRADWVIRDACDQATVAIAAETASQDLVALAEHLRVTEQLSTSLLLRTLCAGNLPFFAAALSVLSGVPEHRVRSLAQDRSLNSLRAVYDRAHLPAVAFDAFASAVAACRDRAGDIVDPTQHYRFTRRVVDEVLARSQLISDSEMNELTGMLRRFAADAARASAREYAVAEVIAA